MSHRRASAQVSLRRRPRPRLPRRRRRPHPSSNPFPTADLTPYEPVLPLRLPGRGKRRRPPRGARNRQRAHARRNPRRLLARSPRRHPAQPLRQHPVRRPGLQKRPPPDLDLRVRLPRDTVPVPRQRRDGAMHGNGAMVVDQSHAADPDDRHDRAGVVVRVRGVIELQARGSGRVNALRN